MVKRSQEDAAETRSALLAAAFEEIYKYGFQAASVANIVKRTHLTKGAFFHHFPDKKSLGYAVVDEVIAKMIRSQWVAPLRESRDPLTTIADEFEKGIEMLAQAPVNLGCPLNNLAQEMSPVDEGFRQRTAGVFAALGRRLCRGSRAWKETRRGGKACAPKGHGRLPGGADRGNSEPRENHQGPRRHAVGRRKPSRLLAIAQAVFIARLSIRNISNGGPRMTDERPAQSSPG